MWVKKTKRTIECDKSTIICDIGITQYDDGTVKYEEKKKVYHWMWQKIQTNVMLILPNVTMKQSNVRKKKKEPPNVTKE